MGDGDRGVGVVLGCLAVFTLVGICLTYVTVLALATRHDEVHIFIHCFVSEKHAH